MSLAHAMPPRVALSLSGRLSLVHRSPSPTSDGVRLTLPSKCFVKFTLMLPRHLFMLRVLLSHRHSLSSFYERINMIANERDHAITTYQIHFCVNVCSRDGQDTACIHTRD